MTSTPADPIAAEARDLWFEFLCRKYVQRADERQAAMGLQYTEAETNDLAKECAASAQRQKAAGRAEASAWRRVDVDPPPNDEAIFLTYGEGRTFLAKGSIFWHGRKERTPQHLSMAYITHWQPLPPPPEGGDDD